MKQLEQIVNILSGTEISVQDGEKLIRFVRSRMRTETAQGADGRCNFCGWLNHGGDCRTDEQVKGARRSAETKGGGGK